MKKMYILVFSVIIVIAIVLVYNAKYNEYIKSYYGLVGFSEKGILVKSYDQIIEEKGRPNNEVLLGEDKKEIYYPGYKIYLRKINGPYILGSITIVDKNIKLGRGNISIGSTKFHVQRAYAFKKRIKEVDENVLGFVDGKYNVFFEFDENSKVKTIKFGITDFH